MKTTATLIREAEKRLAQLQQDREAAVASRRKAGAEVARVTNLIGGEKRSLARLRVGQ